MSSHSAELHAWRFLVDERWTGNPGYPPLAQEQIGVRGCRAGEHDCIVVDESEILAVVDEAFARLTDGDREITVLPDGAWRAAGAFNRHEIGAILADPRGWEELAGTSWLTAR